MRCGNCPDALQTDLELCIYEDPNVIRLGAGAAVRSTRDPRHVHVKTRAGWLDDPKIPFIRPSFPGPAELAEDFVQIAQANWYTNFGRTSGGLPAPCATIWDLICTLLPSPTAPWHSSRRSTSVSAPVRGTATC